eukprot:359678-Chlamydomonas_euryale.AAC.3
MSLTAASADASADELSCGRNGRKRPCERGGGERRGSERARARGSIAAALAAARSAAGKLRRGRKGGAGGASSPRWWATVAAAASTLPPSLPSPPFSSHTTHSLGLLSDHRGTPGWGAGTRWLRRRRSSGRGLAGFAAAPPPSSKSLDSPVPSLGSSRQPRSTGTRRHTHGRTNATHVRPSRQHRHWPCRCCATMLPIVHACHACMQAGRQAGRQAWEFAAAFSVVIAPRRADSPRRRGAADTETRREQAGARKSARTSAASAAFAAAAAIAANGSWGSSASQRESAQPVRSSRAGHHLVGAEPPDAVRAADVPRAPGVSRCSVRCLLFADPKRGSSESFQGRGPRQKRKL